MSPQNAYVEALILNIEKIILLEDRAFKEVIKMRSLG